MDTLASAIKLRSLLKSHDFSVHQLSKIGKFSKFSVKIGICYLPIKRRWILRLWGFHSKIPFFIPDSYLEELNNKISSRTETGFISGGYQLILRKCVLEGFHSLVQSFRDKRWREIQDCVNGIISELSGEEGHRTNNGENDLNTEEFDIAVQSLSMEFSELHRGCWILTSLIQISLKFIVTFSLSVMF